MDVVVPERELTVREQVDRMRDEYPGFAVLYATPWIVIWQGALCPYRKRYQIHLLYCALSLPIAGIVSRQVHVEVAEPLLSRRSSEPQTPIPHIYPNRRQPQRPRLCLHRPEEWASTSFIASTIVPWTVEWLAGYEGWKATGTWYAGGHSTEREHLPGKRRGRG